MNRAERRRQERSQRKTSGVASAELEIEVMQPWADVLMRVKLPQMIIDAMLDITDKVLQDPDRKNWGENLAGQIEDEPLIPHELMQNYKVGKDGNVHNFFMDIVGRYVQYCSAQQATSSDMDKVRDVEWLTQMKSC